MQLPQVDPNQRDGSKADSRVMYWTARVDACPIQSLRNRCSLACILSSHTDGVSLLTAAPEGTRRVLVAGLLLPLEQGEEVLQLGH